MQAIAIVPNAEAPAKTQMSYDDMNVKTTAGYFQLYWLILNFEFYIY